MPLFPPLKETEALNYELLADGVIYAVYWAEDALYMLNCLCWVAEPDCIGFMFRRELFKEARDESSIDD
jgi:hypothetical protein